MDFKNAKELLDFCQKLNCPISDITLYICHSQIRNINKFGIIGIFFSHSNARANCSKIFQLSNFP